MRRDESWMDQAECRGKSPTLFYANDDLSLRAALLVCGRCGVRRQCLEYALCLGIEDGVWGGRTERERRRLMRATPRSA